METSQGPLHTILDLLRRHRTDLTRVEVKSAAGGLPRSLWESISAFSNTDGGLVVLGLDEATGFAPAAGFDARSIRDAAVTGLQRSVTPPPLADVDLAEVDGSPVVLIDVRELPPHDKPCFVTSKGKEGGSYERRADGDHRMGTYQVFLHSINVKQPEDDTQPVVGAGTEHLDEQMLERVLRRLRRTGRRAVSDVRSDEEALRRINVLARGTEHAVPTVAGLLALGRYPQEFFPQLMITVAVYPGVTKDAVDEDLRMLDHRTIDGPLPDMVDLTVETVVRNLRTELRSRGAGTENVPEIPVDVIREAVANAVTHRDYSHFARGDQVRVEVYPDRVEVVNSGGIWGGRSERELLDGGSRSRNAILALLLQDVPFADRDEVVCENKGSGIPRMTGLMRKRGLAIPRFRDRTTTFTVTLDRYGLLEPATRSWLDAVGAGGLATHAQCALAMLRRGESVDDQSLRHQLGIDSRDAQLVLADLVRGGWLINPVRRGTSFDVGDRITEPQPLPLEEPTDDHSTYRRGRADLDARILDHLRGSEPLGVHDLVAMTGYSLTHVRNRLRVLVDQGQVSPTAARTSRLRRYRLAD